MQHSEMHQRSWCAGFADRAAGAGGADRAAARGGAPDPAGASSCVVPDAQLLSGACASAR